MTYRQFYTVAAAAIFLLIYVYLRAISAPLQSNQDFYRCILVTNGYTGKPMCLRGERIDLNRQKGLDAFESNALKMPKFIDI